MSIPVPYQIRLATNGIDVTVEAAKSDIWQILEPKLPEIIDWHIQRSIEIRA